MAETAPGESRRQVRALIDPAEQAVPDERSEEAIAAGCRSVPDLEADIAEFWLEASRIDEAVALFATLLAEGPGVVWPPGRNAPCWCGSERKYKKCCGPVAAAADDAS